MYDASIVEKVKIGRPTKYSWSLRKRLQMLKELANNPDAGVRDRLSALKLYSELESQYKDDNGNNTQESGKVLAIEFIPNTKNITAPPENTALDVASLPLQNKTVGVDNNKAVVPELEQLNDIKDLLENDLDTALELK